MIIKAKISYIEVVVYDGDELKVYRDDTFYMSSNIITHAQTRHMKKHLRKPDTQIVFYAKKSPKDTTFEPLLKVKAEVNNTVTAFKALPNKNWADGEVKTIAQILSELQALLAASEAEQNKASAKPTR